MLDRCLRAARDAPTAPADADVAAALAELASAPAGEVHAWAEPLADAVQASPAPAFGVVGALCLVRPDAQRVLTPALIDALVRHADDAPCAFAHMLAEAASHAPLRAALGARADVHAWLGARGSGSRLREVRTDTAQTAACADLARIKLAIAPDAHAQNPLRLGDAECAALFGALRTYTVEHARDAGTLVPLRIDAAAAARADALEGLYYLVSLPALRDALCDDAALVAALVAALGAPERRTVFPARRGAQVPSVYGGGGGHASSLAYVVVSILATAAAYPALQSAEDRRIDALRRSALQQGDADARLAPPAVARRVRALMAAGVAPAAVAVASHGELRRPLGTLLHAFVTEQDAAQRGRLVQQGIVRALLHLAQPAYAALVAAEARDELVPIHALARLSVTTDPTLMYSLDGTAARAVAYLAALLLAPEAAPLQAFEAALALTNLASMSLPMASAVAHARFARSEHADVAAALMPMFLQFDSVMMRRALIELLCNVVQDERVLEEWSGEAELSADGTDTPEDGAIRLHTARGRLRLLLLLSVPPSDDTHEVALALAASGTLATLAGSAATCAHLVRVPPATLRHVGTLVVGAEDAGPALRADTRDALALRGLAIVASLVQYIAWLEQPGAPEAAAARRAVADAGLVDAVRRRRHDQGSEETRAMTAELLGMLT